MAIVNIKITLDADQLKAEAGDVQNISGKLEAGFESATASVAAFAVGFNQALELAGKAVDVLSAPIEKFAQFETAMANVESLGVSSMASITDSVLTLASDISVPIQNLTGGLYEVVSAGVDSASQFEILELSAKAAKAGLAETTDALNLGASVIKGYGLEWSETQEVLDDAFNTVKLGQTTFKALAGSIGQTVPLASALHVASDQLFGSFATLTGVTGSTSEVATQLKAVFTGMAAPTEKLTELVQSYGFASVEAALQQRGFSGVLEMLQAATGGSAAKMTELFGSVEAVNALLALTGSQYDNFTEKTEAMTHSAGLLNQAYEVQDATIASAAQAFQNELDIAQLKVMESLAPLIKGMLDLGTNVLQVDWTPFVVGAIAAGGALVAMNVSSVIAGFGGLVPAIRAAQAAVMSFGSSLATATGGVSVAVGVIATLVTWLVTSHKSEAELAQETKKTAEETLRVVEAEKKRVEQSIQTNGATAEATEKLKGLNDELRRQRLLIEDSNVTMFKDELRQLGSAFNDFYSGWFKTINAMFLSIDLSGETGKKARNLLTEFGDDYIGMNAAIEESIENIIEEQNELGDVDSGKFNRLEKEKDAYQEIHALVSKAASAQADYNRSLEARSRLLEGKLPEEKEKQAKATAAPPPTKVIAPPPIKPEIELPTEEEMLPEMQKLGKTFEEQQRDIQERLQLSLQMGLISEEGYYEQRRQLATQQVDFMAWAHGQESMEVMRAKGEQFRIEQEYAKKKKQMDVATTQTFLASTKDALMSFQGINEDLFSVGKGVAYAEAVVNTYAAATKALAAYPPPFSFIAAAVTTAAGLANVIKISQTKFEKKAGGGLVDETGQVISVGTFGDGENRFAYLNDGEFIVRAQQTKRNLAQLTELNASNDEFDLVPRRQRAEFAASGGAAFDFETFTKRIEDAIQNVKIEIRSEIDTIKFLRDNLPEAQREIAKRSFA